MSHAPSRVPEREVFPPTARTRRATVACTRCRKLRGKCKHNGAIPPCVSCQDAGPAVAETCKFVGRNGKEIRNSPATPSVSSIADHVEQRPTKIPVAAPMEDDKLLPPREEVFEACKVFMDCYFQLGFLPKVLFLNRLQTDFDSMNIFLLLSILSVSARFTPSLVRRYGGHAEATKTFVERAERLVPMEIYKPSLENVQAFILLGTAEWANGDRNRSVIHLGVASTTAGMLRLHREETYKLSPDAQPEDVINSESARRTLWVMGMQRNLFSGGRSPVPFSLDDITALLPCEESDFSYGLIPDTRAALPGSRAAVEHPELVNCASRSLFATLIQAHSLWGRVARSVCFDIHETEQRKNNLWESSSEYSQLSSALNQWEAGLPRGHRWSEWFLKIYRTDSLDLAYVSIFMALRLSNIVLRRTHLEEIKSAILGAEAPPMFWDHMSHELFTNMLSLHEGIHVYVSQRSPKECFPPIMAFCVYNCGSLALNLWRYPQLCPRIAHRAESIFHWSLGVLVQLQDAWPLAIRWHKALQAASVGLAPTDTSNTIEAPSSSSNPHTMSSDFDSPSKTNQADVYRANRTASTGQTSGSHLTSGLSSQVDSSDAVQSVLRSFTESVAVTYPINYLNETLTDNFEAELESYLQGDDSWGIMSGNITL